MLTIQKNLYSQVEDKHGAIASIYFSDDNDHEVVYVDNNSHEFFTEFFSNTSIEIVEQSVLDWAHGKRALI